MGVGFSQTESQVTAKNYIETWSEIEREVVSDLIHSKCQVEYCWNYLV